MTTTCARAKSGPSAEVKRAHRLRLACIWHTRDQLHTNLLESAQGLQAAAVTAPSKTHTPSLSKQQPSRDSYAHAHASRGGLTR